MHAGLGQGMGLDPGPRTPPESPREPGAPGSQEPQVYNFLFSFSDAAVSMSGHQCVSVSARMISHDDHDNIF